MGRVTLLASLLIVALAGCAPVTQSTAPVIESGSGEEKVVVELGPAEGSERFAIVPANSRITVLTFRSGPMARLGHNHVITSSGLTGTVWVAPELEQTLARVVLPVDSLVVDDEAARSKEGEEFSAPVPEKDRIATRSNMLGEALLNESSHSFVRATCGALDLESDPTTALCDVSIAGKTLALRMPIVFQQDDNQLSVSGEFTVTHEQLGLTPFSAAGGAVRVADGMTLRYEINAQRLSRARD
ncbi:MAG: hypothetical protein AAFN07_00930 [Pseudomonadota bacterium]